MSLIMTVFLTSCTSVYQIVDFFHESAHCIASFVSGDSSQDHTHDIIENLADHENDSKKNKYLLDKNTAKITSEIINLEFIEIEPNFHLPRIYNEQILDSNYQTSLYKPPIS